MPGYAIVEAPSALAHVPEHVGVERAPEVLLAAGLANGLAARRAGRVAAAGYCAERDPVMKAMNPRRSATTLRCLPMLWQQCLMKGSSRSCWRRLCDPARHDAGAAAARPLWPAVHRRRRRLLPARGQPAGRRGVRERSGVRDRPQSLTHLADIEGRRPLVRAADVVVFACRDAADRKPWAASHRRGIW